MKSIEKGEDDITDPKFYPALISKAKFGFYNRKVYLNYFRRVAQEQGIAFLIGIAFGVNLVLLLQMSEDIVGKLSDTLTNSAIGIVAVLSTLIIGIAVIHAQRKTYRRIRTLIDRQHTTTDDEGG
jgi:hypothetical protein